MLKQACVILVSSHVNTKVSGAAADLIRLFQSFRKVQQKTKALPTTDLFAAFLRKCKQQCICVLVLLWMSQIYC